MQTDVIPWQAWAFLSALFAALTAVLAKVGVEEINSDLATFIRTVVIVIVLGLLLFTTGQRLGTISGMSVLFLTFSGLATGASWVCYFRALKVGDATRVAPIDKLSIVWVAILAAIFLGETLSVGTVAGIILMTLGGILIATS